MQNLKILLISEAGNAIILVLFTALICVTIIGGTLYITFNQFQYSQMYKKSFNIDYIALSGAEKAICTLNNNIKINFSSILNDVISEILLDASNNDNKDLEYINDVGFKIKNENLKNKIETKIFNILDSKLNTYYKFRYNVEVESYKYNVEVELIGSKGNYSVVSKAKDINTNIVCKATGIIYLENNLNFDSTIFEQYDWKNDSKPEILSNALITNNVVELKEEATLNVSGNIVNENISNDITYLKNKLDRNVYEENIVILKEGEQELFNIQMFYDEQCPQPSIIIDIRDNKKITLISDDENVFNGIIYSTGQIEFANDIIINGVIISNNIIIDEGVNLNINYNTNNILNLTTDNYKLKRDIYDFLEITNYKNYTNILGYLKLKTSSSVNTIINNINDINFKLINLRISDI